MGGIYYEYRKKCSIKFNDRLSLGQIHCKVLWPGGPSLIRNILYASLLCGLLLIMLQQLPNKWNY